MIQIDKKKYVVCVIFSIDLLVLVWISEILRSLMMAFASTITLTNVTLIPLLASLFVLIMFLFGFIPLSLLIVWSLNPLAIKKLFATFALTEKSLDKRQEKTK